MYTPHPSLVPIEMASAGMLTVTNSFENKTARGADRDLAQPDHRRAEHRGHRRGARPGGRGRARTSSAAPAAARCAGAATGTAPSTTRCWSASARSWRRDRHRRGRRSLPGGRAAAGQPALRALRLAARDRGPGVLGLPRLRPFGRPQPAGARRRGRRARQPGADPLLRHLGLPALPALRRRAGRGPAGARTGRYAPPARCCGSCPPTGWRSPCWPSSPGSGVFNGDWWRYYLFLQLYSHDTVAAGIPVAWTLCVEVSFYLVAAAVGARRAAVAAASSRRWPSWPALRRRRVQVAAARNVVSDLLATNLLGQCTWLALGMALAVASVAVARRDGDSRPCASSSSARACAGWAPPRRSSRSRRCCDRAVCSA